MNALGTYSIFHFDVFFKVNPITTIDSLYFACFLIGWTDNSFKKRNIENENKRHENNKIIIYILPQSTIDGWPSNNPSNSAKKKKKNQKRFRFFCFDCSYIYLSQFTSRCDLKARRFDQLFHSIDDEIISIFLKYVFVKHFCFLEKKIAFILSHRSKQYRQYVTNYRQFVYISDFNNNISVVCCLTHR